MSRVTISGSRTSSTRAPTLCSWCKQWREGTDPKRPVWQRLAGTMVELAVDYVKVDPGLFGGNGKGDRIDAFFSAVLG